MLCFRLVFFYVFMIKMNEKVDSLYILGSAQKRCIIYTANVYKALWGLYRFSLLQGNPVIFTDCGEILKLSWGSPAICKYYNFIHNIHMIFLRFLQPFSKDCSGFPCKDPAIPCPCSFHGVKNCSVELGKIMKNFGKYF